MLGMGGDQDQDEATMYLITDECLNYVPDIAQPTSMISRKYGRLYVCKNLAEVPDTHGNCSTCYNWQEQGEGFIHQEARDEDGFDEPLVHK